MSLNIGRKNRSISLVFFLISVVLTNFAIASVSNKRSTYIYCNVYTDNSCFGVVPGESVKINLPSDFFVYEVIMSGGSRATVYSGGNPNIKNKALEDKFEDCTDGDGVCGFLDFQGGVVEAVYSRARNVNSTHLIINGVSDSNFTNVKEFVENFRACKSIGESIDCGDVPIFKIPSKAMPSSK